MEGVDPERPLPDKLGDDTDRLQVRLKPATFDLAMAGDGSAAAVGRVQCYAGTRPVADIGQSEKRRLKSTRAAVQMLAK
jgi:hypothetical protein